MAPLGYDAAENEDPRRAGVRDEESGGPVSSGLPDVASTTRSGGLVWGLAGAVAVGAATLLILSQHRLSARAHGPAATESPTAAAAEVPPPEIAAVETAARSPPPAPPPVPPAAPPPVVFAPPAPQANTPFPMMRSPAADPDAQRRRSPTLVVDLGAGPGSKVNADAAGGAHQGAQLTGDEQFAARIASGEGDRTQATRLRNPSLTVPQGAIIPAVLETALNSDLPGMTRAVVSHDVLSFDGMRVLIPKGSRVVGQYKSGLALGASRAFVIWSRLLRPDGGAILLGSTSGDPLGRAGLAGSVDRHFYERFSGAVLLSVLNVGAAALVGQPSTQVVIGTASESSTSPGTSAVQPQTISPTISVPQGTSIRIFVAKDLDFSTIEATP